MKYFEEKNDKFIVHLPYGERYVSFEISKRNLSAVLVPETTPGAQTSEEIRKKVEEAFCAVKRLLEI